MKSESELKFIVTQTKTDVDFSWFLGDVCPGAIFHQRGFHHRWNVFSAGCRQDGHAGRAEKANRATCEDEEGEDLLALSRQGDGWRDPGEEQDRGGEHRQVRSQDRDRDNFANCRGCCCYPSLGKPFRETGENYSSSLLLLANMSNFILVGDGILVRGLPAEHDNEAG